MDSISSPCIGLCTLNSANVCLGCGRNLDEIIGWAGLSEPQRLAIMTTLPEPRLDTAERERSALDADAAAP